MRPHTGSYDPRRGAVPPAESCSPGSSGSQTAFLPRTELEDRPDPQIPTSGTAPTSELKMVPLGWQFWAETGEMRMSWRSSSSSGKKEAGSWEGIHSAALGCMCVGPVEF